MPRRVSPLPLHQQVSRLYFRVVLPAVTVALVLDGGAGTAVLIALMLLAALGAALHLLLPPAGQNALRFVFALAAIVFVVAVAVLAGQPGFTGTIDQLAVALLLTPATLMAWTLVFADQPRTGQILNLALVLAVTALMLRWQALGLSGMNHHLPLLVLLVGVTVTYYASTFALMNARFHEGEHDRTHDPLTGLLNRRAFQDRARTHATLHVAVLDIDFFKRVNDAHGHLAGDRVLRAVADVIQDTLHGHGEAYRWGGEEFVLLLPATVNAPAVIEQVRREIAARHFSGGQRVTLSAGLTRTAPGEPVQRAFERADAALRAAKDAGRNRVVLSSPPVPLDKRAPGR
ncbi:hypothetical protein GCM10008956_33630 [Deinococcus arenae]|uniref:GGDEF domain-containing protein n=1 Tax=Deinococcus arenae TaxID=1452751 RepID=A0A8H9GRV5_9DEIO|nr:GGDEF domain-containing protein [Deinococcus arenae]AWT34238.1 hypothetical protein DM785_00735 [Deinococcus actinosclerus]GGM54990.1 hypothetical protein GCM10008956_33630 [Deinococcus arenae]